MAYKEITGNIFNSNAQALVNTVNCVGAMGKGIALEFRRRFPKMFEAYQLDCENEKLKPGNIYPYKDGDLLILNFAIKDHWKYPSKMIWIESSLEQFVKGYKRHQIKSVAFPWMGAMNGGLPLDQIKIVMRKYLSNLEEIEVEVYTFDPDANDPLFERLQRIASSPEPEKFFPLSGLQYKAFIKIIQVVKNQEVKSLPRLIESGIVGSTSIDKLYGFLGQISFDTPPTGQLPLF